MFFRNNVLTLKITLASFIIKASSRIETAIDFIG